MKNLKMFAIAVMAFAVMAMGVHATGRDYPNGTCTGSSCEAIINSTHKYTTFAAALAEAKGGDTIKLLKSVTVGSLSSIQGESAANPIKKALTINVSNYTLNLDSHPLFVGENGALTITGTKDGQVTYGAATNVFFVADGGSLTIKGALTISNTAGDLIKVDDGKVTISDGAKLSAVTSGNIITIGANGAEVSLNANVGTKAAPLNVTLVNNSTALNQDATAKVTFEGGEYYLASHVLDVNKGYTVTVNDGTIDSSATGFKVLGGELTVKGGSVTTVKQTVNMHNGDVTISGGTLKSTARTAVITDGAGEGSFTVTGGVITSAVESPLYFKNGSLTYSIAGGTVDGPKNTPAIYIEDSLLTGMEEDGDADHFKGMVTAGKFLYSVVGGTVDGEHSSADVTKYIVAEGKDVTTEGDYKVVGTGTGDTPVDPETSNPSDIPPVPQTNDNILVYAGLGLVSLASVAFTAKKRED